MFCCVEIEIDSVVARLVPRLFCSGYLKKKNNKK